MGMGVFKGNVIHFLGCHHVIQFTIIRCFRCAILYRFPSYHIKSEILALLLIPAIVVMI